MTGRTAACVAAVLAFGGLMAASAPLTPDPAVRRVVVGAGPLDLTTGPDPGAALVARVPGGSAGIIITGRRADTAAGEAWEVLPPGAGDRPAWALAARLAPGEAEAAPLVLQCSGTEPFWGLKLSAGEARMSRPGAAEVRLRAGPRRTATGAPLVFAQALSGKGRKGGQAVVIRRAQGCSDGMSDLSYPYEAVVTTPSGEVLSGCCRRSGG